jgi:CBS domain-containing protein
MTALRDFDLAPAAIARGASFRDAAAELSRSGLGAIAVVDDDRRVIGLFTEDDLLRGLFPRYLEDLHHTAFTPDSPQELEQRLRDVSAAPVEKHMSEAITVEADTSTTHAAERFLHCAPGALAVVEADGRFAGMLAQSDFCREVLRTAEHE